jgi:GNAT superfamily N-acetyltransferase
MYSGNNPDDPDRSGCCHCLESIEGKPSETRDVYRQGRCNTSIGLLSLSLVKKDMKMLTIEKNGFVISTDKRKLQPAIINDYLSNRSYWAKGRPLETTIRAIEGSLCFGVYLNDAQIGFARVISDFALFGYIADVFILEDFRGRGLSKWLMEVIVSHPDLQGLKRWVLATSDAHGLYAQYGFHALDHPASWMEMKPGPVEE